MIDFSARSEAPDRQLAGLATPTSSAVYLALRRDIMSLELPPGKVLSRQKLARQFGVSQMPLREAIQALKSEGLIDVRQQACTKVSKINPKTLFEVHFLRSTLECEVVRRLARLPTEGACQTARLVLQAQEKLVHDARQNDALCNLDRAFHRALFEGLGMGESHRIVWHKLAHLTRCQALQSVSPDLAVALAQHRDILQRIEARDASGADLAMRAHLADEIAGIAETQANYPDYFTDDNACLLYTSPSPRDS